MTAIGPNNKEEKGGDEVRAGRGRGRHHSFFCLFSSLHALPPPPFQHETGCILEGHGCAIGDSVCGTEDQQDSGDRH